MIDTTIYIGDVAIHEPVTAFTDYLITLIGFFFYFKLSRIKSRDAAVVNWSRFFLFIGLSTMFGGSAHGFFEVHSGWLYKTLWLSMQLLNGFAIYFAQQATLVSVLKNSKSKNIWSLSYFIQLLLFIPSVLFFQNYLVTIIGNAIGLIPVMILHLSVKPKEKFQEWIGYGIAVSFLTALVHGTKFSLHAYFNFNDIAHLFIMVSLSMMFIGANKKALSRS